MCHLFIMNICKQEWWPLKIFSILLREQFPFFELFWDMTLLDMSVLNAPGSYLAAFISALRRAKRAYLPPVGLHHQQFTFKACHPSDSRLLSLESLLAVGKMEFGSHLISYCEQTDGCCCYFHWWNNTCIVCEQSNVKKHKQEPSQESFVIILFGIQYMTSHLHQKNSYPPQQLDRNVQNTTAFQSGFRFPK